MTASAVLLILSVLCFVIAALPHKINIRFEWLGAAFFVARLLTMVMLCVGVVLWAEACASKAPASLSPAGVRIWQADQAVVIIGDLQHVAIGLNGVQVCDPAPCHPLLSDANTRIVVDAVEDGVKTIHTVPAGWKATAMAALDRISARLDAAGQHNIASYVDAARAVLQGVN